jgi:hypothetical protein
MTPEKLQFQPRKSWNIDRLEEDLYLMTLKDKSIAMTGSAVNTDFSVNEPHQLIRLEVKHTDAAKADSGDAKTDVLYKYMNLKNESILFTLYSVTDTAHSIMKLFGNGQDYKFPHQNYRLALNSTNLHLAFPELTIRRLP